MLVTIEKIARKEKVSSKTGKPFTSLGIMVDGKWINGFLSKANEMWRVGDCVEIELKQNGEYLNFETVDPIASLSRRVAELEKLVIGSKPGSLNQNQIDDEAF